MADHALADQLIHIDDFVSVHALIAILKHSLVILPAQTSEFLQGVPILRVQSNDEIAFMSFLTDPDNDQVTIFDTFIHHGISGSMKQIEGTGAEDFCLAMGWTSDEAHRKQLSEGIQQELFADNYTAEEQIVIQALMKDDSKQINVLAVETNIPISELSSLLFSLEMKGAVQMLVGGKYKLRR